MKRKSSVTKGVLSKQISDYSKHKQMGKKRSLLSSGSTTLDLALGGGYPVGKIINIVGDKSTGKTLLAAELIAQARSDHKKKLKWYYDDAEEGFSFDTELMYGFEMIPEDRESSYTIEDFSANLASELQKVKQDEILVYVLDTFDGLTSKAELERAKRKAKERTQSSEGEDSKQKGTYNLEKQKVLGEFFRVTSREIKNKSCLLVVVSQVRQNIGVMFGEKYVRTGGKALDHSCAQIIWLAETEKYMKKERATGVSIKAQVRKNKIGKPFRETFVDILFDYGIDDISSNINYLFDLKDKRGKTKAKKEGILYDGERFTPSRLLKYIEENNLEESLKQDVIKKWQAVEDSITPKRKVKYE